MSFCFSPPKKRSGSLRISSYPISLVTGGEVSRVDPESTGLNPAWRNSLVYATLGTGWEDGANSTQIEAARQLLIQDMKILEGIAPDSGAYLNEVRTTRQFSTTFRFRSVFLFCGKQTDRAVVRVQASRYEFDWKKSFFGTHYDRLRAIKRKYDPESLFIVYEGIGSDEWDADLICRI